MSTVPAVGVYELDTTTSGAWKNFCQTANLCSIERLGCDPRLAARCIPPDRDRR